MLQRRAAISLLDLTQLGRNVSLVRSAISLDYPQGPRGVAVAKWSHDAETETTKHTETSITTSVTSRPLLSGRQHGTISRAQNVRSFPLAESFVASESLTLPRLHPSLDHGFGSG